MSSLPINGTLIFIFLVLMLSKGTSLNISVIMLNGFDAAFDTFWNICLEKSWLTPERAAITFFPDQEAEVVNFGIEMFGFAPARNFFNLSRLNASAQPSPN